jgi:hypothetical protein
MAPYRPNSLKLFQQTNSSLFCEQLNQKSTQNIVSTSLAGFERRCFQNMDVLFILCGLYKAPTVAGWRSVHASV